METIRFDDIAALQKHVSADFGPFGEAFEVTQDVINRFADVTGDHQWIHVDVERAKKESPFKTTIAHGFLTLSLLPMMNAKGKSPFQLTGQGNAVNYGSDKLRFLSPVPSGSKIHARSRLVSVEAGPKGTRVETEVAVHVVGNDRPALLYSMIVLYQGKVG
ncbi:MAG: MaoC family dehydratase [Deltaproteobacteria bacterium]|nr:MaoC family dehydratase [Deltaproteobacteria bacterium]